MKKIIRILLTSCFVLLIIFSSCYNQSHVIAKQSITEVQKDDNNGSSAVAFSNNVWELTRHGNIRYDEFQLGGGPIGNWSTIATKLRLTSAPQNEFWAYCIESGKDTPPAGLYDEMIVQNDELLKILYYGFGGIEPVDWAVNGVNDWRYQYLITHILANYAYTKDMWGVWGYAQQPIHDMNGQIQAKPSPGVLRFSETEWKGTYNNETGTQRTQTIKFEALPKVKVYIPVQEGVILHNITTGETFQGNGIDTVAIQGQQEFYLETNKVKMNNYNQTSLQGENLRRYYVAGIKWTDPNTQIESTMWYTDDVQLGFNLTWEEVAGDFPSIEKVDQNGTPLANVDLSLYPADSDYTITGDAVIRGKTNHDGKLEIDTTNLEYTMQSLLNKSKYYVLKEALPDGYRKIADVHLEIIDNVDHPYFVVNNVFETGAISERKQTIKFIDNYDLDYYYEQGYTNFVIVLESRKEGERLPTYYYKDKNGIWKSDIQYKNCFNENPTYMNKLSDGTYEGELDIPSNGKIINKPANGVYNDDEYSIGFLVVKDSGSYMFLDDGKSVDYSFIDKSEIILPNIKNTFTIEKVNANKEPLTGATFGLYTEEDIDINDQGEIILKKDVEAYDSVEVDNEGKATFGVRKPLKQGNTYYLFETQAPLDYEKREYGIKIEVKNNGIYADAGKQKDGVTVQTGLGSLIDTMKEYAVENPIDMTLYDIKAKLQRTSDFIDWMDDQNENWNQYSWSIDNYEIMKGEENHLLNDELFGRAAIYQDNSNLNNKKNLNDMLLNHLFTGETNIQIENMPASKIIVEKKVNGSENDMQRVFKFTIEVHGVEDGYEIPYKDISSVDGITGVIKNGSTFTLKHGQKLEFRIPAGKRVTITEEIDSDFTTKYYLKSSPNNITYSNVYEDIDGVNSSEEIHVVFENSFYGLSNFEFTKTDDGGVDPLSGANFVVYEKKCTHNHDNDLIEVNKDTGELSNETQKECWMQLDNIDSDGLGKVIIENLKTNKEYRLIEYKAPDEYITPKGQWILKYNENSDQFEVTGSVNNPQAFEKNGDDLILRNFKMGNIPLTGEDGVIKFAIAGIGVMLIGGLYHCILHTRSKRKNL